MRKGPNQQRGDDVDEKQRRLTIMMTKRIKLGNDNESVNSRYSLNHQSLIAVFLVSVVYSFCFTIMDSYPLLVFAVYSF